ncbi:MAG: peptidylprolyl isomerase [Oleiphilaceae bacterium]|nr:peptidylprolyl isomerase [Oleiphilaceae bacterium]
MKAIVRHGRKAVVLLMTLLMASVALAERKPLDSVVAIVDDEIILQSELDSRIRAVASRLNAQGTRMPPRDALANRVLEKLVTDAVQLQRAEEMGIRVSDNELNETMRNIASRNNMSLAQFEAQLQREGMSYRDAREQIRQEMLISRVQQRQVDNRVRVTSKEVENFIAASSDDAGSGLEYQLAHILIAVDDFNDTEAAAAAEDKAQALRQEIAAGRDFQEVAVAESDAGNALEGGVMGWRPRNQLPTLVEDVVPDLSVGEPSKVLRSGSGFHIVSVLDKRGGDKTMAEQAKVRHILVSPSETVSNSQAEQLINSVYDQLEKGANFAELAREYSDDPGSGAEGGDLGWVGKGEMVPAFESAMLEAGIGELKGPFRSRFGWHILEVQDRREKDIGGELKQAEARQSLYRRKFEVELQNWLREIRDEAYVEIKPHAMGDGENS